MHAPKFLTSGKIRFNRASEASHLARNAADTFAPPGNFLVIKSSLISARINAGSGSWPKRGFLRHAARRTVMVTAQETSPDKLGKGF
jgi:hypothetical protein